MVEISCENAKRVEVSGIMTSRLWYYSKKFKGHKMSNALSKNFLNLYVILLHFNVLLVSEGFDSFGKIQLLENLCQCHDG